MKTSDYVKIVEEALDERGVIYKIVDINARDFVEANGVTPAPLSVRFEIEVYGARGEG